MRLHLFGLPHTITTETASHCAFTAKVLKFPEMMRCAPNRYEIIHYGVAGAETESDEHVDLMTREEQSTLRGHDGSDKTQFIGNDARTDSPLYIEFNRRLRQALTDRVDAKEDLVLTPFGHAYDAALYGLGYTVVESGIGYPTLTNLAQFKVYESFAWMHFHQGRENRNGKNYEWVVPNYFDTEAWDFEPEPDMSRVVFLGRIGELKGLSTIVELARRRPDLNFEICGQGDPAPYLTEPNIRYVEPLEGRARSAYLGNARACLMPTVFTEPFAGVGVECQMTGTPVISTSYGAFTETIEDEVTGFRCHTLGDFLAALERAPEMDREYTSDRARRLYGYDRVGKMYDRVFQQIADLKGEGWYTPRSYFGPAVVTSTSLPVSRDPWAVAQGEERKFHVRPEFRGMEQEKRKHYARQLGIDADEVKGKRIIDIGCGPESLLLSYPGVVGTALDPLRFTDDDEARYEAAGIVRVIEPAEELNGEKYDEAWAYNCLQHVKSPEAVIARAKQSAQKIRIWEWCNIPTDALHLHVLTAPRLRAALEGEGWRALIETEGRWSETTPGGMSGEFYSAVWHSPS